MEPTEPRVRHDDRTAFKGFAAHLLGKDVRPHRRSVRKILSMSSVRNGRSDLTFCGGDSVDTELTQTPASTPLSPSISLSVEAYAICRDNFDALVEREACVPSSRPRGGGSGRKMMSERNQARTGTRGQQRMNRAIQIKLHDGDYYSFIQAVAPQVPLRFRFPPVFAQTSHFRPR